MEVFLQLWLVWGVKGELKLSKTMNKTAQVVLVKLLETECIKTGVNKEGKNTSEWTATKV